MTTQNPHVDPDDEVGAFAVPEDLDWETTGFADEDLSGRPVQVTKQAAPRPVPAPQPVPQAAPQVSSAPARLAPQAPVQQPVAQQPVQQPVSAPPVSQAPAPQAAPLQPPVQQPVQQVVPQAPAMPPVAPPVQQQPVAPPVQQQPVAQPYPAPAQPLPPQSAPAPDGTAFSTVPGSGYAPATKATLEDLSTPEWAHIVPEVSLDDDPDADPVFTGGGFEQPIYPSTLPAPLPEPGAEGRRKEKRAPKPRPERTSMGKKKPTAREGKTNAYAGGRWTVKVLRVLIFTVAGVLLAGGLKNVIVPRPTPDTAEITSQVEARMGLTGFPTGTAETFAVRFAREYLTYDQNSVDARTARLRLYSPAAAQGDWGWDGHGSQSVITGPYVSAPTQVEGKHFATVTVTAQVSTGQWLALAVPVYADETGALVVSGAPAFEPLPAQAENPGKARASDTDNDLSAQLSTDTLLNFFTYWASGDGQHLDRYITRDATVAARTGLAGTVIFKEISAVVMPPGGDTRTGTVTVVWSRPNAGLFTQEYRVTVAHSEAGWQVKDVTGGVIADSADPGTSTDGETVPGLVTSSASPQAG